jgi:hypothetical protein
VTKQSTKHGRSMEFYDGRGSLGYLSFSTHSARARAPVAYLATTSERHLYPILFLIV